MGIFDIFRKNRKPNAFWRDANNNIVCLEEKCPVKPCDESCPILCHLKGIAQIEQGAYQQAIPLVRKAVTLEPNFVDAWVTLGFLNSAINNTQEAYKAFKTAYDLGARDEDFIQELIIVCKKLRRFEECTEYFKEYVANKNEAMHRQSEDIGTGDSEQQSKPLKALDMALDIIEDSRKNGLLPPNNHFQNIPEILVQAKPTCIKILDDILQNNEPQSLDLYLVWGAYAGIGAVYHWHIDWASLKRKGIAETLLEPRGSFAMDEYVIDSIGIGFETPEGSNLNERLRFTAFNLIEKHLNKTYQTYPRETIIEGMQAMYMLGMVYEMERLGMR